MIRTTRQKFQLLAKRRKLPKNLPQSFVHKDVPYYSQWESPELVGKILMKEISAQDDPKWESSGATSKEEYEDWSNNGCGMACLRMVLASLKDQTVALVDLGKESLTFGVYTVPVYDSVGLKYKPFKKFVETKFGLKVEIKTPISPTELVSSLASGSLVIASVNPMIREPSSNPPNKSGHLVLVVGYDLTKGEYYIHNPSGIKKNSQAYSTISTKDFNKFFSNRGIVISTSTQQ